MYIQLISIYIIFAIIGTLLFGGYIQAHTSSPHLKVFLPLTVIISLYLIGYLLELNAATPSQALFWMTFQSYSSPFIASIWLSTALIYTYNFNSRLGLKRILIYTLPTITMILRSTNNLHHLYYTSINYEILNNGQIILLKSRGFWNYVQILGSIVLSLVALGLYIYTVTKRSNQSKSLLLKLIAATGISGTGLIMTLINFGNYKVNFLVLSLPIAIAVISHAVINDDFLEVVLSGKIQVFDKSNYGILLLNKQLDLIAYNEYAKDFFKSNHIELANENIEKLVPKENPLSTYISDSIETPFKQKKGDNTSYYNIDTQIFNHNTRNQGTIKIVRDVTSDFLLKETLIREATIDSLSGLYNRKYFFEQCIEKMNVLSESTNITLLMLDIDHFKRINDTYGHLTGDQVIQFIGNQIKSSFIYTKNVGRFGGEEFAVQLDGITQSQALDLAENFRETVANTTIAFDGNNINITISIGLVTMRNHDLSVDLLVSRADKALYTAKDQGRNQTRVS